MDITMSRDISRCISKDKSRMKQEMRTMLFSRVKGYKYNDSILEKCNQTLLPKFTEALKVLDSYDKYSSEDYNPYMEKENLELTFTVHAGILLASSMLVQPTYNEHSSSIFPALLSLLYVQQCAIYKEVVTHRNYSRIYPAVILPSDNMEYKDGHHALYKIGNCLCLVDLREVEVH